jgi:hypothetical protein
MKTTAQRSKELRERRKANGLAEVRGIWAKPIEHPRIKEWLSWSQKTPYKPLP